MLYECPGLIFLVFKALQMLGDLPPGEQASWPAIKGALQHRFGHHVFADDDARDKLATRHRRSDSRESDRFHS